MFVPGVLCPLGAVATALRPGMAEKVPVETPALPRRAPHVGTHGAVWWDA